MTASPSLRPISLNAPTYGEEEIQAVVEVLRSTYVTMGRRCRDFEAAFAACVGAKEAVFVNSGSSANLLALFALADPGLPHRPRTFCQWEPEVIVPALAWGTTYWPIAQAGFLPVIVDINPHTLQMDTEAMRAGLSEQTVGVCPVHVLGNTVHMGAVRQFADTYGLWVMEDACEALGARWGAHYAGAMGDLGSFSFFFSHHITTLEGGMVVTDQPALAESLRSLRAHGWSRDLKERAAIEAEHPDIDPAFFFVRPGFNVRPTEVAAAFGLCQLPKLEGFNRRRNQIAAYWNTHLDGDLFTPMQPTPGSQPAYFGYPVLCRDRATRDGLKRHLREQGIETRPIVAGNITRHPAMARVRHRVAGSLAGVNRVMDTGLMWGLHPGLSDAEVEYVAETVAHYEEAA